MIYGMLKKFGTSILGIKRGKATTYQHRKQKYLEVTRDEYPQHNLSSSAKFLKKIIHKQSSGDRSLRSLMKNS